MREARTREEVERALCLRLRVFCVEQGVDRAAEQDGQDDRAIHVVALESGTLVGTCRLLVDGGTARLGRNAVAAEHRGRGIGTRILRAVDGVAASAGASRIRLHAQLEAQTLYERSGYVSEGETFVEEGIDHVTMEKRLA